MVEVYMVCPMCKHGHYIQLTIEQARKLSDYRDGGFIQEIFPELNAVEREFIKTGYCPTCQELLFGEGKSELIHKGKEL